MTDSIRHRGPDGEGFLFSSKDRQIPVFGKDTPDTIKHANFSYAPHQSMTDTTLDVNLVFGHRRLSIIDLSPAGHQPMCDSTQKLWITYNGEVYNYLELKSELQSKGYSFATSSDTEVILNAYREWGTDCVNRFNGMWAFVIYDVAANKLFGSRDRFGVKPLYYVHNASCFAFASEQKALLSSGLVDAKINSAAVFDYFVFSKIESESEGMFADIFELKQAQNFEFSLHTFELKKWHYYSLPFLSAYEKFNPKIYAELLEQTREAIIQSIKLRLRSDVPVGSCLSGGIDSSTIVSVMHELLKSNGKQINVFTASFEDEKIDEGKWAKQIVERTNSKWSRTFPSSEELLQDLESLMYCQDIPIWSTSTYAQYRVMQLAKETGVKVILDGQGGDELWAGYPHHQAVYMRELVVNGNWKTAQSLLKNAGTFPTNAIWFSKQFLKHSGFSSLPSGALSFAYTNYFKHLKYLNKDFLDAHKNRFELHFENTPKSLNELLHHETTSSLLKGYLKCEDRCSMWHSVESRTPFADDLNLIELAFKTPSAYKIHQNESKYIMRQAMKNYLPESILNRKDKMGYSTPNNLWINGIKEAVKMDFNDSLNSILNTKLIQKEYNSMFGSSASADNGQSFKFISYALWHKIFKL